MLVIFGKIFFSKYIFNKITLIILVILILFTGAAFVGVYFFYGGGDDEPVQKTSQPSKPKGSSTPSNSTSTKNPSSIPLTAQQKELVKETIYSSEFVGDIPEGSPISLQFFYFDEGRRIWQDKYILANGEIIKKGTPVIKLTLHSKYLEDVRAGKDLCDIIKDANTNGDLGFETDLSNAKLMWRYKGMLKHRECLGI